MKPQLVVQDIKGAHNGDFAGTSSRLLRGGSWKKQRVVVILPAADLIPAKVALSFSNLIFPPNNGAVKLLALGMEVGDAYSTAIEQVLAHPELSKWEYLFSCEHDNLWPQDTIISLIATLEAHPEYAAVSGAYWTKGPGGVLQAWGDVTDPVPNYRPQMPRPGEVMEVYGLGMGACLFRLAMFKDARLRRPWFKTIAGKDGVGTQDLYFWSDARKYGYRAAVDMNVLVGHYDLEGKFGLADMVW